MASEPRRDPVQDSLLAPENAAFLLIDYQPVQVNSIASMERQRLVSNISRATRAVLGYGLDALREGFEVFALADAVGGTSVTAHDLALRRVEQAGAKMLSVTQLYCELQRDWQRKETLPAFLPLFADMNGAGVAAAEE